MSASFAEDLNHHMRVCRDLALNRGAAANDIRTDSTTVARSVFVLLASLLLLPLSDIISFESDVADGTSSPDTQMGPYLLVSYLSALLSAALGYGFIWGVSGPGGFEQNFWRYFVISNWIQLPLSVLSLAIFWVFYRLGNPESDALQSLLVLLMLGYLMLVITIAMRVIRHGLEIPWLWTAGMVIALIVLEIGISNLTGVS